MITRMITRDSFPFSTETKPFHGLIDAQIDALEKRDPNRMTLTIQ